MANLRSVLRQPDFFRLWFGQVISSIGDRFYQIALVTVVLGLNNGAQVGKESARVIFVGMIPGLLFAPLLGWAIDRFSRKAVLVFADLSRVVLVAAMIGIWFHLHDLALVYVMVFLIGGMNCLFIPARQAALPQLVAEGDLIAANALIAMIGVIASLVSVPCGGFVASVFGPRALFYVTVIGFAFSAWSVLHIGRPLRPEPRDRAEATHFLAKTWGEVSAGWNHVKSNPSVQWLILCGALFSFVTGFFMISVMEFAVRGLDLSSLERCMDAMTRFLSHFAPKPPVIKMPLIAVGLFMGGLGVGLGLGSVTCGASRRWTHWRGLPFAAFLVLGAVVFAFAHIRTYPTALAFCVVLGWSSALFAVPVEAWLQAEVPNACRGRVFALRSFCTTTAFLAALACHLSGGLLRWLGPGRLIEVLGGSLIVLALVLAALNARGLRGFWGQGEEEATPSAVPRTSP